MSARSLFSTAHALALLALAAAATPANATSTQLSEGLPFSAVHFASTPPQISPDGDYAVYVQDAVVNGANELWSVRIAGGSPVRLSDVLVSGQSVKFAISPDSNRVVYLVDQDTPGIPELFSVPIAGGARTKLNMELASLPGQVRDFLISPTSERVYYAADGDVNNKIELWRVDIDGGASTRLNAAIGNSYDIFEYAVGLTSGGSERLVYRVGRSTVGGHELWSVEATGTPAAIRISRGMASGGAVDEYFQISPNGNRVLYLADATDNGSFDLYSVAIAGGSSILLNGALAGAHGVEADFLVSPDSNTAVYRSDEGTDTLLELYSVPLTGGVPTKLNGELIGGGDVLELAISPNGARVVYLADQSLDGLNELWSVPLSGGTATRLNGTLLPPLNAGDVLDFAISPNNARVVYLADQEADTLNELWSVPLGGGTVTKLNRTLVAGGDVQAFLISPDSDSVVYGADQDADTVDELLAVSITGGTVLDLNDPLVPGGDVSLTFLTAPVFSISPDSLVILYAADLVVDGEIELFAFSQVGVPSAPTAVVATSGNTQVTVTFLAPANNGGSPITGYEVTPSPATAGWSDSDAGSSALTHLITGLTNGTSYTFTVRATNANGTGLPSSPSNSVTPASPPGAPIDVVAVAGDTDATVTFAAPPDDGGSTIIGYTVTSNPAGGVDSNAGSIGLSHLVTGLTNGIAYTFTVVAWNAVGAGAPSLPSASVTPEPGACSSTATTLCLQHDKFNVSVTWRDFQGRTGSGQATELSSESGDFWFFNAQSNELIVKIIDACTSTGNYWVFWRALSNVEMDLVIHDTATLQTLTYHNPLGYNSNGHLDIDTIFRCDGSGPATASFDTSTDVPAPGTPQLEEFVNPALISPCVPDGDRTICLQGGRFRVQGIWSDFSGASGNAHLIKKNESSGYAWFFNSNNYEMLFKLVDACTDYGNTWVSIAGLTNVSAALTIRDTWTGTVYRQENALGVDFPTNLDIETNLDYCGPSPF